MVNNVSKMYVNITTAYSKVTWVKYDEMLNFGFRKVNIYGKSHKS